MNRPTISPGQPIIPGLGHGFSIEPEEDKISAPPVAVAPPFKEEWSSKPAVQNQRMRYPDSCRVDKIESAVFDLSLPADLKAYNSLLQRSHQVNGDVTIFVDDAHFSEKTDNWKRFVRYHTILFKQLAPTPTENKQS